MERNIIKVALVFMVGILFFSCEKTIEFKGEYVKPKIVLNGILTPGDTLLISVRKSRSILDNLTFYEALPDAKVKFFEDGVFLDELKFKGEIDTFIRLLDYGAEEFFLFPNGYYFNNNITIKAGSTYRIEVSSEGLNPVFAETTVPYPVDINTLSYTTEKATTAYNSKILKVNMELNFDDPAEAVNFYQLQTFGFRGYEKKLPVKFYYHYSVYGNSINLENFIPSDTIFTTSECINYLFSYDPVFKGESRTDILGTESDFTNQFTDELINGKNYTLSYSFDLFRDVYTEYGEFFQINVRLVSLSKELHLYLLSKEQQNLISGNPFAEPVPVYNNIIGGFGILGSTTSDTKQTMIGEYPIVGKKYISKEVYNQYYAKK